MYEHRRTMFRPLSEIAGRSYDVLVIGGGINGAAVARACARRGWSVALLEKHDFAWGTTWRSTKLIHGGLRYLEHREFGLVFESLHDQGSLLRDYPAMVRPLTLLLPVYRRSSHHAAIIGTGLTLYDLLAVGRGLPRHQRHRRAEALALEPALARDGLVTAFSYGDCQAAYPERLCLQTLLEAGQHGALAANYTTVSGLLQQGDGRIAGVEAHEEGGAGFEVRAALVVNAAGPWVDSVLGGLPARSTPLIGGTKGTHLVVDYHGRGPVSALYAEARSDGRPFFIVPWRNRHLVGTTDTPYRESVDSVRATAEEIAYLLAEANALLPYAQLRESDVHYAYAGVRPLPASDSQVAGAVTRRHIVRDHAVEGHPGLLSVIGGKLSTFRSLAEDVLKVAERELLVPGTVPRSQPEVSADAMGLQAIRVSSVSPVLLDHLRTMMGPRLADLLAIAEEAPSHLQVLCPHGPDIAAQVLLAVRAEGAKHVADVLLRRVGAAWNPCLAADCAERVIALMAGELGWTAAEAGDEHRRFAEEVDRTFTVPGRRSAIVPGDAPAVLPRR